MNASDTRVLLLIEDNPGDAQLVNDLLGQPGAESFRIIHATTLRDALAKLSSTPVDVVVLDLRLPDCTGVDTVKTVREAAIDIPIVVLTGSDDESLALGCINAGAQDYLSKTDIRVQNLRRAIGYAITRMRESQLRELQETLEYYRALSSAAQNTVVTAALAGSGAVAMRSPETFNTLVDYYYTLLEPYPQGGTTHEVPRGLMERVATALGDANGGPRDLLDVHVSALERVIKECSEPHARSIVVEARLLALQMMGLLVDYYRVGQRRRFMET